MKNLILLAFTAFLVSCGKYEEGPDFSLRSKKVRMANDWVIQTVLEDGVDVTQNSVDEGVVWTFSKDGKVTLTHPSTTDLVKGSWNFARDKKDFELVFDDLPNEKLTFSITKLKEKECWFYRMDYGVRLEYRLKEK